MKNHLFAAFFMLSCFHAIIAQDTTAKVVDSNNRKGIPYANISFSKTDSLITNNEGYFTIPESKAKDDAVLTISYLGYASTSITVGELKKHQFVIALRQGIYELNTVNVSKKPDPYKIMTEVRKNLTSNYGYENEIQPLKNECFYRKIKLVKPEKLDLIMTKSTGLTEKEIQSENIELKDLTSKLISHPPQEFKDNLCNYYTRRNKTSDNKWVYISPKLEVIKAVKIGGNIETSSFEDLKQGAIQILQKYLDSTKYYRAYSGIGHFSNDSISSNLRSFNKYKKNKKDLLNSSRFDLEIFLSSNNPQWLDFVKELDQYDYSYESTTYSDSDEKEAVYVLSFKPRKSKAIYSGKLYISEKDYAVVRIEYNLVEGETTDSLNLKLLLGIKYSDNVSKGTLIYKQNTFGPGYYLHYGSVETGEYIYVNRPLEFIEVNRKKKKKNKDVHAFDVKTEFNIKEKKEYLNMSRTIISEEEFDKVKEQEFDYIKIKEYDPKIWKNYSTIEPLEEMKQYKAVDDLWNVTNPD